MSNLESNLLELKDQGLLRQLRPSQTRLGQGNFASNDYLGLSQHPMLKKAFIEGVERYGVGSGSSRLVNGNLKPHVDLESQLAALKGTQAALTFSSGFNASLAILPSLLGKDDFVVIDKLAHACLIDGVKLSGCQFRVFPHNDLVKLESHLQWCQQKRKPGSRVLIICETVYSMDGDVAPLDEIVTLKQRYDAELLVDEAHAIGVLGAQGMGLANELKLSSTIEYQMGTFSKAVGVSGGYLACSETVKQWLVNKGRAFIYSTAPPAPLCLAISASLSIISSEEGAGLRSRLHHSIQHFSKALDLPVSSCLSAIVPIKFAAETNVVQISESLKALGLTVPAIRYPTVPKNAPRLRVSLSATHEVSEIDQLALEIKKIKK